MTDRPSKPCKTDFSDPMAFMRASAAWAAEWNVWPWDQRVDDDDNECFELTDAGRAALSGDSNA